MIPPQIIELWAIPNIAFVRKALFRLEYLYVLNAIIPATLVWMVLQIRIVANAILEIIGFRCLNRVNAIVKRDIMKILY